MPAPRPLWTPRGHTSTRRQLLGGLAAIGGGAALGGCSTAPDVGSGGGPSRPKASAGGGGGAKDSSDFAWWDQFNPLAKQEKAIFSAFHSDGGPKIDYTVYNPNDQGKALQLAHSSHQMPDVFSLAGVSVPPAQLVDQGWFAPIGTSDTIKKAFEKGALIEGVHIFDDQLYSFPIFGVRQYTTIPWFNKDLAKTAGVDPENPPTTWDDLRKAGQRLKKAGSYGLTLPLTFAPRMESFVTELALVAGFPGDNTHPGLDLTTGEYRFHDDAFLQAVDFLHSFKIDKTLFPASTSLDARSGRARWIANGSGWFFDGSWNVGVVVGDFASFLPKLGVGPIPTPNGETPVLTSAPTGGTFWISKDSQHVDEASELLTKFVGDDFWKGMAKSMDQPPYDETVVADSAAKDPYKKAVDYYKKQVFVGPSVEANPGVSDVEGVMKDVTPGLGEIVQGVFSGQVKDVKSALTKLSDSTTAARDAAIRSVAGKKGGTKVSADAWAFPHWTKGTDYRE